MISSGQGGEGRLDDSVRISEEVGKRIRDIRIAKKMSQQELAVRANLSLPHISDIELGKKAMKLVTFVRIIEALRVPADAVLQVNGLRTSRPYDSEILEIIEDCSPMELETLKSFMVQLKDTMRRTPYKE